MTGITLKSVDQLGENLYLYYIEPSIHTHGVSFNLVRLSLFFLVFKFSSIDPMYVFIKRIPQYFVFFGVNINGIVFIFDFSVFIVNRWEYD